jgi:hypothetical protein
VAAFVVLPGTGERMGKSHKKRRSITVRRASDDPLPSWQNDWLYQLVFQFAEKTWKANIWIAERHPDAVDEKGLPKPVLIEEFNESDDSMVVGPPARAWLRDERGLIPIDQDQASLLKARTHGGILHQLQFFIWPDRSHVTIGERCHSRSGSGTRFRVIGEGDVARLEADPGAGFWIS